MVEGLSPFWNTGGGVERAISLLTHFCGEIETPASSPVRSVLIQIRLNREEHDNGFN